MNVPPYEGAEDEGGEETNVTDRREEGKVQALEEY
jgi:hypothetical protein